MKILPQCVRRIPQKVRQTPCIREVKKECLEIRHDYLIDAKDNGHTHAINHIRKKIGNSAFTGTILGGIIGFVLIPIFGGQVIGMGVGYAAGKKLGKFNTQLKNTIIKTILKKSKK